jgi:hypothetical protein
MVLMDKDLVILNKLFHELFVMINEKYVLMKILQIELHDVRYYV